MQSNNIWDRQAGESAAAYAVAWHYFALGSGRSLREVSQKYAKSIPLLKRYSAQWNWQERAEAYDLHLHRLEQQAKEEQLAKDAEEWARRRAEAREQEWTLGQALIKKAETMLLFPLQEVTSDDGATKIAPADWNYGHMLKTLELASKLNRLALGLETDRTAVDLTTDVQFSPDELEALDDAELEIVISYLALDGPARQRSPLRAKVQAAFARVRASKESYADVAA